MKSFFFSCVFAFCLQSSTYSQTNVILEEYLNLATFIVDYDTYAFEGGHIGYYQLCNECTTDSIPFLIDYDSPGDFGGINFSIQHTLDTIFKATIIWMGTGQIYYPESFSTDFPFTDSSAFVPMPADIEIYNADGLKLTDSSSLHYADTVWGAIDSLVVSNLFAEVGFKAAIYLYPPTVGAFDPSVAKWVVWLFYNPKTSGNMYEDNINNIRFFPNPTSGLLVLKEPIREKTIIEVYNSSGIRVMQICPEINSAELDFYNLPKGLYLLKMYSNSGIKTNKFIKI
jgi:hypothetical protein